MLLMFCRAASVVLCCAVPQELYDSGCVTRNIKYGVMLYGTARITVPLDIQVRMRGSRCGLCGRA